MIPEDDRICHVLIKLDTRWNEDISDLILSRCADRDRTNGHCFFIDDHFDRGNVNHYRSGTPRAVPVVARTVAKIRFVEAVHLTGIPVATTQDCIECRGSEFFESRRHTTIVAEIAAVWNSVLLKVW